MNRFSIPTTPGAWARIGFTTTAAAVVAAVDGSGVSGEKDLFGWVAHVHLLAWCRWTGKHPIKKLPNKSHCAASGQLYYCMYTHTHAHSVDGYPVEYIMMLRWLVRFPDVTLKQTGPHEAHRLPKVVILGSFSLQIEFFILHVRLLVRRSACTRTYVDTSFVPENRICAHASDYMCLGLSFQSPKRARQL